jgi:Divergent InlB B-repeat domain/PASTA domain
MRRFLGALPGHKRGAAVVVGALALALSVEAGTVLAGAAPSPFGHGPVPRSPVAVGSSHVVVGHSVKNDVSPALRTLRPVPLASRPEREANPNPLLISRHHDAPDPVVQQKPAKANMPSPNLNFEGIPFPGVSCNCLPPDTNGEVGATQYVQIVNQGLQVFDKTTGGSVLAPIDIATLWNGFGGVCEGGFGDPVVLYDQLANRWVVSQFAGTSIPTDECIAVSTSSDAAGSYNRYDFHLGTDFFDYPKIGVWPDAYYMSMNVFNSAGNTYLGPQPFAFNRAEMLAGSPATFVTTGITNPGEDPYLPADLDGLNLPPAGAPNPFVEWPGSGGYRIYRFHVDWAIPGNSTFTLAGAPAAAGFTVLCFNNPNCVPQPGTSVRLDALADRLMFRAAYRNFGGHESLVTNYTVSSGAVAGVRWVELRNLTSGSPTVAQESTYQPDSTWRWMGSAAMDGVGDLALGFSVSSATTSPSVRYAGRLAGDPPNTLVQGEASLIAGGGSQTHSSHRWGDYSDMTVDPVDDCTFWYTQEYYASTASVDWRTRIGSFKFPSCAVNRLTTAKAGSGSGSVTSSPAGINCGGTCSFTFAHGSSITLHAGASAGSAFAGWSGGGCSGTGSCTVKLDADKTVTATFVVRRSLTVTKTGTGSGTVTSSPAGINCGATCSAQFTDGAAVTLAAAPAAGSRFTGWSGGCSGTGTCGLTMSANRSASATFAKVPKCVVPKVVGLKLAKARARIKKAHCRVGKVTKKFSTRKKKGRVLAQRPKPRKSLKSGAKVNLVVGKGSKRR